MRWSALIVGSLALASCGGVGSDSTPADRGLLPEAVDISDELALEVFGETELARMLDTSIPHVSYPVAVGLAAPGGPAEVWRTPQTDVTSAALADLADALGVSGDAVEADTGFGPGWTIGAPGSGSGFVEVQTAFGASWSMYRSADTLVDTDAPPTDDDIEQAVTMVLEALGVARADVEIESRSYDAIAEIDVSFVAAGVMTDVRWSFAITTGGVLVNAGGPWRAPEPVGAVDLVLLDEVLVRLGRVSTARVTLAPVPTPSTTLAAPAPTTITAPTTTVVPTGEAAVTAPPPTVDPAQFEFPTITSAESALTRVWTSDDAEWFVPAYRLRGDHGFDAVVAAISSEYVSVVEPTATAGPQMTNPPVSVPSPPQTIPPLTTVPAGATVPPPTTTLPPSGSTSPPPTMPSSDVTLLTPDGTPVTVPIPPDPNDDQVFDRLDSYGDTMTQILIGRPLDEAIRVLEGSGWTVRVIDLDNPRDMTDDLRSDRTNVRHRSGIVESVEVF